MNGACVSCGAPSTEERFPTSPTCGRTECLAFARDAAKVRVLLSMLQGITRSIPRETDPAVVYAAVTGFVSMLLEEQHITIEHFAESLRDARTK